MAAPGRTEDVVRALRSHLSGEVVGAGDEGYETARSVWNGMIDKRPAAVARCAGPDDVAAAVGVARAAGLPVAVRGGGHNVAGLAAAFVGPPDAGEEALRPLRGLATPIADLSGLMAYAQLQQFQDDEYPRGRHYYWKSAAVAELSDAVIDIVEAAAAEQPSSLSTIDVWPMGGALRDDPAGGSAYSGRSADWLVNPEADWDEVAHDGDNVAWPRDLIKALEPHTTGTYLNFPGLLEEGDAQLRAAFGANYDRLVEVKTRWDPDNVFRLNHNIPPRSERRAA